MHSVQLQKFPLGIKVSTLFNSRKFKVSSKTQGTPLTVIFYGIKIEKPKHRLPAHNSTYILYVSERRIDSLVIHWTEVILNSRRQKLKFCISMSYAEVFLPSPTLSSIINYNVSHLAWLSQPVRNSPGVPWLWVPLSSWVSIANQTSPSQLDAISCLIHHTGSKVLCFNIPGPSGFL